MITLQTNSEAGSVLIGNQDWTFAVPNFMREDGTTTVIVDPDFDEMNELEDAHDLKPVGFAHGSFGIYDSDVMFRDLHYKFSFLDQPPTYIVPKGIYRISAADGVVVFHKTEIWTK